MCTSHCYVTRNDKCVCLHAIFLQGQDPWRTLGIGIRASSMLSSTKEVTKQAAPTKLRQALYRVVLRGSGSTQQLSVMVLPLNKYRTPSAAASVEHAQQHHLCATTAHTGRGSPRGSVSAQLANRRSKGVRVRQHKRRVGRKG